MKTVEIHTPYIKLDALLKFADLCRSGGEAKLMIQLGQVEVNGEVCTHRGKKLRSGDIARISMEGKSQSVRVK